MSTRNPLRVRVMAFLYIRSAKQLVRCCSLTQIRFTDTLTDVETFKFTSKYHFTKLKQRKRQCPLSTTVQVRIVWTGHECTCVSGDLADLVGSDTAAAAQIKTTTTVHSPHVLLRTARSHSQGRF